jgi:hypothetical protein
MDNPPPRSFLLDWNMFQELFSKKNQKPDASKKQNKT